MISWWMGLVLTIVGAWAADDPDEAEVVLVEEPRSVTPPCRIAMDARSLRGFPARRPETILRSVPGMRVTSRLGFGGAYSFSYRGLDSGHGRDIAFHVAGVPVNEPSHVLDPGYVDLHFLPMSLIYGVDICTGVTQAEVGAHGTSLSVDYQLGMEREGVSFSLGGGSDGSGAVHVSWRPRGWDRGTFVLAELDGGEGVGEDRSWRHVRLAAGVEGDTGPVHGRAVLLLHDGVNDVPTPLRESDLLTDEVRFYGGYGFWTGDAGSRRLLLTGQLVRLWPWGGVTASAWFAGRGFRLRDNLTGTLFNGSDGDGRWTRQSSFEVGLRSSVRRGFRWIGDETRVEGGIDLQARFLRQQLASIRSDQVVLAALTDDRIEHNALAAWTRLHWGIAGVAAITPSLRIEQVDMRRRDALDPAQVDPHRAPAFVAAPRVGLVARPWPNLSLQASFSRGFRPPDARRLDTTGRVWFTRLDTLQGGFDLDVPLVMQLSAHVHHTWSKNERIIHPLDGSTLMVTSTQRLGVDARLAVSLHPAARLEVDGAWNDARDSQTGNLLPFIPRWMVNASGFMTALPIGPVTLTTGLRVSVAGPVELPGGFRARGGVTNHLTTTVGFNRWFFRADMDNMIPVRRRAAEYFYPSRWVDDPVAPISELPVRHVVPGEPFALRLTVGATY